MANSICPVSLDLQLICHFTLIGLCLDHSMTLEWPIDPEFQEAFDKVKYAYAVQPLPVYRNGKYIEPPFVPGAMRDALVMVSFSVMHYRIQKNDDKTVPHESFTGKVVDVVILKIGEPGPPSPLKRKNIRDGPLQLACITNIPAAASGKSADILTHDVGTSSAPSIPAKSGPDSASAASSSAGPPRKRAKN